MTAGREGYDPDHVASLLLEQRHRKSQPDASGSRNARAILRLLRDLWRRTATPSAPAGLVMVGPALVHDHADGRFLHLVRTAHPESRMVERAVHRPDSHVIAFTRAVLTLLDWSRHLRMGGVIPAGRDLRLLGRDAVSYSVARRAIRHQSVTAVVVSGDLIPKRLAIAAAANAEGVPVDLVLNDQDHGRSFHPPRFRGLTFRTAFVFEPHDACRVASPPHSCALVPVTPTRPNLRARSAGIIIGATTDVEQTLRVAAWLLGTGEVDEVLVRRHPRDRREQWVAPLPSGVRLTTSGSDLSELADRVLLAICDPATTGTIAALRAGISCFTSWHFDGRSPLVDLPRIDDRTAGLVARVGEYPNVDLRPEPCDAQQHVPVVPFEDALALTLGTGSDEAAARNRGSRAG